MYLIHIKDILNNQEFIYNIKPNETFDFKNCIKFLINQLSNENKSIIKYDIFENYSEIYHENEFKNRGWIWTSTEKRKDILYILTKIKILNTDNNFQSTSTQTDSVKTDNTTKSNIHNIYSNHCNNLNFLNEDSTTTPYYNDNYFNCLNNRRIPNQLSSGYAKNQIIPMWPDNLITELEQKFSKLNFGLNQTNPNYF